MKKINNNSKFNSYGWLAIGVLAILLFAFCDLKYGAINYSWHDIITAVLHPYATTATTINIIQVRLPIILIGLMAGSGLAIAGLLLQRVTQNPLACPSLSGIEYGTALCVILSYMFVPHITHAGVIGIAIVGGLLTYLLLQIIVKKSGVSTVGITLIGVAFNALYYSAIQAILLAFPYQAQAILYDLNGSLHNVSFADVKLIFLPFVLLLLTSFLVARRLDLMGLDDFQASSLGFSIKKFRLLIVGLSILLATLLTSVIGPLLFFGLIVPHLVKPITKGSNIMLFCAIFGAAFLLSAELMTRILAPQTPPPVGIITLLMAAPMLIWITRRYVAYVEN